MDLWDSWKKGVYGWEDATAKQLEQVLGSPLLVGPSGWVLKAVSLAKSAHDRGVAAWWAGWGLPTRAEQERVLHTLHEVESRLIDLEERLEEMSGRG